MKVEKCPRCGFKPSQSGNGSTWCWVCDVIKYSIFQIGADIKWNRWARREAKRIAKEGKGK